MFCVRLKECHKSFAVVRWLVELRHQVLKVATEVKDQIVPA